MTQATTKTNAIQTPNLINLHRVSVTTLYSVSFAAGTKLQSWVYYVHAWTASFTETPLNNYYNAFFFMLASFTKHLCFHILSNLPVVESCF